MTDQPQVRELPLYNELPPQVLSPYRRAQITRIIFGEPENLPRVIDTVMTLSAADVALPQARKLKRIFNNHTVGQLVVTGGEPWNLPHLRGIEPDLGKPQSDVLLDTFGRRNLPKPTVLSQERTSTNTKENVVHGWDAMKEPAGREIAVVTNTWHMGRGMATVAAEALRRGWEGAILPAPFASTAPSGGLDTTIHRSTWHKEDITRDKVGAELARLRLYGDPARRDLHVNRWDYQTVCAVMADVDDVIANRQRGRTVTVPGATLNK